MADEMATVLCDIEAMVNSRPLIYISDDDMALTPAHLLIGKPLLPLSIAKPANREIEPLTRWKYQNKLLDSFWNCWKTQYLPQLQEFQKWRHRPERELQVDDIVLVNDGNRKRGQWPMARIVKTIPGRDGLVRSAVLSNGLRRPVQHLHLMEADAYGEQQNNQ